MTSNHFTLQVFTWIIIVIAMFIILCPGGCSQQATPPSTEIRMVTDTLHGTVVEDPYRWLENWDDPDVRVGPTATAH